MTASSPPARPGPPVDLGALPQQVGFVLRLAQLAVFQDFLQTFAAEDIRPAQLSVLTIIERNPGIRQSAIGAALAIKPPHLVPLLDSLERRGLAERRRTESDRRSYALFLTEAGSALMATLDRLRHQHERRLVERLGEDGRAQLLELLGRLL